MSVKIRCRRAGSNNDPCFRIVATDIRAPRDGQSLEILGWYDPKKKEKNFWLNLERIEFWKKNGAELAESVASLVKRAGKGKMASRTEPQISRQPKKASAVAATA